MSHWIWPHLELYHFPWFVLVGVLGGCALVAGLGYQSLSTALLARLGIALGTFVVVAWGVAVAIMEVDRRQGGARNEYRGEGVIVLAGLAGLAAAALVFLVLVALVLRRAPPRGPSAPLWLVLGCLLWLVIPLHLAVAGRRDGRLDHAHWLGWLLGENVDRTAIALADADARWGRIVATIGLDPRTRWLRLFPPSFREADRDHGYVRLEVPLADPEVRRRLRTALDSPDAGVRRAAFLLLVHGVPELRRQFTSMPTAALQKELRAVLDAPPP
jgi:hypothetical protein